MSDDLNVLIDSNDLDWFKAYEVDLSSLKIAPEEIDWSFLDEPVNFDADWLKTEEFSFDDDWLKQWEFDWNDLKLDNDIDVDWFKDLEVPELSLDDVAFWQDIDNNLIDE